ncbi:porin family protein [Arenibacter troitsensis]|uniref:Outer membrane protein beta-barrel domain-containing protein n=1 Tax=Arenibacter troitsensis TaxID=188872 RepID=A0A1X7I6S2_9FLAO|nr:porin family protein [Arenibacter troitsensis]SMG10205.1 Outer membrane protein beta-barrel domain-containing protein [Arenibacter troitsensis]
MKKLLLTSLLLTISYTIFAQSKSQLGVRMGLNNAKVLNSGLDNKSGLYTGLFLAVRLTDSYTMQPEIIYSNQGGKASYRNGEDLNINYVSIALANKFFVSKNQGFHFILGPSLDINFDDNFINLINDNGANLEITPIDLAVFGGIGYEFDFGLALELRYKQGLIDLDFNDSGEYGGNAEENQLNRVFQIGLAYKFNM